MKKIQKLTFLILAGVLLFSLAACGSPASTASSTSTSESENVGDTTQPDELSESVDESTQTAELSESQEMPISQKLALGTLMLEETDLAVTPEQAMDLLPLWKAVNALANSDTAATAEIQAVYDQIQETMAADQIKAIEEMELNQDSTQAVMDKLGIEMPAPGARDGTELTEEQRARMAERMASEAGGTAGGGPGGGSGGGLGGGSVGGTGQGGQAPNSENLSDEERATMQAQRGTRSGMNNLLVDPLIELLTTRAAE